MRVSIVQWRLTIGCFNPRPWKNFRKSPRSHVYPNTGCNFITPLHNVSLCLLTIFVVFFTISGIEILASNKAAIRLSMGPIRTQFLYKPSLLICMDIHPDPGPVSVNNLPTPVRKLYNQTRRINSRIVRSKHRLQIFHSHIHYGTLQKGYGPKINPAIGSYSQEFQNDWANNLRKCGNEQLKLSINETNK